MLFTLLSNTTVGATNNYRVSQPPTTIICQLSTAQSANKVPYLHALFLGVCVRVYVCDSPAHSTVCGIVANNSITLRRVLCGVHSSARACTPLCYTYQDTARCGDTRPRPCLSACMRRNKLSWHSDSGRRVLVLAVLAAIGARPPPEILSFFLKAYHCASSSTTATRVCRPLAAGL